MLLKITKKCSMGCSHCLENATSNGEHMDMQTFEKSLAFIKEINPMVLLITGGEPTEHPEFFTIMNRLIVEFGKERLLITSNGVFLYNKEFTEKVLELGVKIQITNDVRYYPFSIDMSLEHELIHYETHINSLFPQGRAVVNGYKAINKTAPNCFNLRSISCNNSNSLKGAIHLLEMHGKFCAPSIDIVGGIHAGESTLCHLIGNVEMEDGGIFKNLTTMKCNRCKMEDNLSFIHLKAINSI